MGVEHRIKEEKKRRKLEDGKPGGTKTNIFVRLYVLHIHKHSYSYLLFPPKKKNERMISSPKLFYSRTCCCFLCAVVVRYTIRSPFFVSKYVLELIRFLYNSFTLFYFFYLVFVLKTQIYCTNIYMCISTSYCFQINIYT